MQTHSDTFHTVSLERPRAILDCEDHVALLRFCDSHVARGGGQLRGPAPGGVGQKILVGLRLPNRDVFWLKATVVVTTDAPPGYWIQFAQLTDAQQRYLDALRGLAMPDAMQEEEERRKQRLREADGALARGDHEAAFRIYDALGPLPAARAGIEVVLGLRLAHRGAIDEAAAHLRRALALDPGCAQASRSLRLLATLQKARRR